MDSENTNNKKGKNTVKITTNGPNGNGVAEEFERDFNAGGYGNAPDAADGAAAALVGEVVDDGGAAAALGNVATKTSDPATFNPDTAWLNNPAPLDTDDHLKARDDAKLAALRKDRRDVVFKAREHLKAPGAVTLFCGVLDSQNFNQPSMGFFYEPEGIVLYGKLAISFTPRLAQLNGLALARYLSEYVAFKGTTAEIVDQITHDLFIMGKPEIVKVKFATKLHGLDESASASAEW